VAREIEATLRAGFTTVRDAGGLDFGYKEAARRGLIRGPRLFVSNGFISQTGGHGDFRPRNRIVEPRYRPGVFSPSLVVDGPDRVRWAAREVLRRGADQVKVMANGGCMSPSDELSATQFSVAELRAAVEEASAAGKYVMAHTYTPRSMHNCMDAGIRTLEHGNFLDEATASRMAATGTYLVPTIATYELIAQQGRSLGVPEPNVRKIEQALAGAYESLKIADAAGVRIGSGSDVLGPQQPFKARELAFKSKVLGPMRALLAATRTNAEILGMGQEIGTVEEGKLADLLLVDGDPLDDPAILEDASRIHMVLLEGEIVVELG
jgi:imidazolonepropionase-like amidohydrolase